MELLSSWIQVIGEDTDVEGSLWDYDPITDVAPFLGIDIGGSLIKLVCFSMKNDSYDLKSQKSNYLKLNFPIINGRLHFKKFETRKINECIEFIGSNLLHNGGFLQLGACTNSVTSIKATGGGAFKFSDIFKEKLGISLDKVDEMDCLVAGANFLLKTVHNEAFTYMDDKKTYVQINHDDLYPYLLVNIGSGVSMIKVEGDTNFERISGTSVGGGTFWGLGKLLTKCDSFDELLMLSHEGNNKMVDMLVGDIYGGTDYAKIGLSSTTIASSFGRVVSGSKELQEYRREDLSRSLLRMISNNIGQISYLNALRFGLKRIFFGGFFIRGQAYTMDTISVAVDFWSKGEAKAMFMKHEGFLGALGALMNYDQFKNPPTSCSS